MKIPVVLSTVRFTIDHSGRLNVDVDGQPYADDRVLRREDLRSIVHEIASSIGTAVRVEVCEADGSTFSDIATPKDPAAPPDGGPGPAAAGPAISGAGFRPGEEVALAYVVARQEADTDGHTAINLPPALLSATRSGLVLVGLTSLAVAPIEAPA